ncbi:DUF6894 family protein [Microvirga roseola]|uniref:DUF6894 family protein n=1 Tax=Microvirga roseola TaxID=2883126 RepID=UPI001E56194A|nr:hypothetical protein [Microvirga roseola]
MRCYFNLVNGHEKILDDVGIEVSDLETATAEALRAIGELRQEEDGAAEEWAGWRLEVVCPEGNVLCSLPLNATLH